MENSGINSVQIWGFVLNVLGLLAGIIGVALAIRSNMKLRTAREAEKEVRADLMCQVASEHFSNIALHADTIQEHIRARDWEQTTRVARNIRGLLAQGAGSWGSIVEDTEKDQLVVATANAREILAKIPMDGRNIEERGLTELILLSDFIAQVTGETAGRLKYKRNKKE